MDISPKIFNELEAPRSRGAAAYLPTQGPRSANTEAMTPETALRVAMAVGDGFRNRTHRHVVVPAGQKTDIIYNQVQIADKLGQPGDELLART